MSCFLFWFVLPFDWNWLNYYYLTFCHPNLGSSSCLGFSGEAFLRIYVSSICHTQFKSTQFVGGRNQKYRWYPCNFKRFRASLWGYYSLSIYIYIFWILFSFLKWRQLAEVEHGSEFLSKTSLFQLLSSIIRYSLYGQEYIFPLVNIVKIIFMI